jgi:hypothetical protein
VRASPEAVFAYLDDHERFSAHMTKSSWMMAGGKMTTAVDEGGGQAVGSHIRMAGTILGIRLALDEVVTLREPPHRKVWETTGEPSLLVIGPYRMGVGLSSTGTGTLLTVFLDYRLPRRRAWLGRLFGGLYARWCVRQMLLGAVEEFGPAS